jgi:hypothetical protein
LSPEISILSGNQETRGGTLKFGFSVFFVPSVFSVPSVVEKKVSGKKSLDFFLFFCYRYPMVLKIKNQFVERQSSLRINN